MIRLRMLLDEHSEAVEFDLIGQGLRLGGLWTGELSWRELNVVIDRLPPESATKTAMREALSDEELKALGDKVGTNYGPWSKAEHLLAGISDKIAMLQWVTIALQSPEKHEQPAQYPRPGVARPAAERKVDMAAATAHLQAMRDARHLQLVREA
jgi:hypothetical protein